MSNIAVQGGAGGTGTVTLLAPSTSTDRVLTLPDTTGTLVSTASSAAVTPAMLDTQAQYTGFKNRIINGAMVIDQRNAGASVTNTAGTVYTLDRWKTEGSQASKFTVQQNAGAVTPPAGYSSYLGVTSTSAYTVGATDYFIVSQNIEANNIVDIGMGLSTAVPIAVSFWVRSSLTGTFGGVFYAPPGNPSYPFTYTISAANTWEQKSVTISGVTYGTWNSGTANGGSLVFGLGAGTSVSGPAGAWVNTLYRNATGAVSVVGTNAATWYVTGVQLEKGSTATSFDYRPYGTELGLCQRYYFDSAATSTAAVGYFGMPIPTALSIATGIGNFAVTMRATPTVTFKASSPEQAGVGVGAATAGFITLDGFARANKTTGSWTTGASIVGGFTASAEL